MSWRLKAFWIGKPLNNLCAINVSEQQMVITISKWRNKTEINLNFNHLFLASYAIFLLKKIDQHDQWGVLNLLAYNFGINDNFEQGGIVPITFRGPDHLWKPWVLLATTCLHSYHWQKERWSQITGNGTPRNVFLTWHDLENNVTFFFGHEKQISGKVSNWSKVW